jgi:hypothetical protein
VWRSARRLGVERNGKDANSARIWGIERPSMRAPAAIAFYDSRALLTERRAKLDRRLAGIASEFAVQWELNRVDSALTQLLPSGSETYWGLSDRVPAPDGAQRSRTAC